MGEPRRKGVRYRDRYRRSLGLTTSRRVSASLQRQAAKASPSPVGRKAMMKESTPNFTLETVYQQRSPQDKGNQRFEEDMLAVSVMPTSLVLKHSPFGDMPQLNITSILTTPTHNAHYNFSICSLADPGCHCCPSLQATKHNHDRARDLCYCASDTGRRQRQQPRHGHRHGRHSIGIGQVL